MELYFIRHGQTASNGEGRYLGRTDEPLSPLGIEKARLAGCFPNIAAVAVSPMLRARETAGILFPNAEQRIYPELREMDFGDFEGRPVSELMNDPAYKAWVECNCTRPCPNGEDPAAFAARCTAGLERALEEAAAQSAGRVIFVVHGGVIMNLMSTYADPNIPFFDWYIKNCACFCVTLDPANFQKTRRFISCKKLDALSF